MISLFTPGTGPFGLDAMAALAAVLTALVATNVAPMISLGAGRVAEWVSRGFWWMDPARRRMNKIGDASIRHQIMVGQTTIGDALLPGLCLFFAGLIGFLAGNPLGLGEFWNGHRNPLINDIASHAGIAQAVLVLSILVWAISSSILPILGRLFTRLAFLLPQTLMRIGLVAFLILSGLDIQATLLTVASTRLAVVPLILLSRGLAILGPAGLIWLPFAIVSWLLELVAVAALGPLHAVLRPLFSDVAERDGIGSGFSRRNLLRLDRPTLEECFAGDTLHGARRPG